MRKLQLKLWLFTLLLAVGGVSPAWADEWSINFASVGANYDDKTNVTISAKVATIGGTDMGTCTVVSESLNSNFVLQTGTTWLMRKASGLYQGNGGGRAMGMLNCTAGQIITIVGTGDPNPSTNATLKSQNGNTYVYTVTADGNVKFTPARYLYFTSITVENPSATAADYTVKYVDESGNEIKTQTTGSGDPNSAITLTALEKASFYNNDGTIKYIYVSDDSEGKTIASDGTTVVTITFREAATWSYTVNNSLGSTLTSGSAFEQDNSATVSYPQYVLDGTTLYKAANNQLSGGYYQGTFAVTEDNLVKTITYAQNLTDVVFYSEAEDIEGATARTGNNNNIRCSMGTGASFAENTKITSLPAGIYKISTQTWGGSSTDDTKNINFTFTAGENTIFVARTTGSLAPKTSEEFTLTAESDIYVSASGDASKTLDLVYIQKTGDYDPNVGEHYIYSAADGKFLSRGADWGTRAIADNYGVPANVTLNDGVYNIQFLDNLLYLGSDGYADKAINQEGINTTWTLETVDGGFKLKNGNGSYAKITDGNVNIDGTAETATVWSFKTIDEQKAIVAATQQANIVSVATANGWNDVTTTDAFTAKVAEELVVQDQTALIKSATAGNIEDWTYTQTQATGQYNGYNTGNYGAELFRRSGYVSQTITVPEAGIYKLTLNAFYREGSNAICQTLGAKGYDMSNAYVSINDTYFARIPDWYSEADGVNPDNTGQAKTAFEAGKYAITVYAYVGNEKELTIKLHQPNWVDACWMLFNNFALTYYAVPAGVAVESVSLDKESATIALGDAPLTLTATVLPDNADDKNIIWTSSDETVATVANGVVTALNAGTATITATSNADDTKKATCEVTVTQAAAPSFYSEIAAGDFYIMNAATGKFLGGDNAWGTQASLIKHGIPFTAALNDGKYTLDSHTYNKDTEHFLTGTYVDGAATNLYITSLGSGKYSISTADGSAFVSAKGGTTVVDNTAANANSALAQWYFISKNDRDKMLAAAKAENPVDATYYIKEANISRNLAANGQNNHAWSNLSTGGDQDNSNFVAQVWNASVNVEQTIKDIPNGTYTLTMQGFTSGTDVKLYANETEVVVRTNDSGANTCKAAAALFAAKSYPNTLTVTVTDRTLKIGLKGDCTSEKWLCYDNFELEMTGYTPVTAIDATIDNAEFEIGQTATITAATDPAAASFNALSYSSSNETVATVDANGVVTGVAAGEATITVKAEMENVTKTFDVTVVKPAVVPTKITLNETEIALNATTTTFTLTAEVGPEGANQAVTFASSDETVATVNAEGVVTAVLPGTATITVTSAAKAEITAEATVTVTFPESEVPETYYVNNNATRTVYTCGENLIKNGSFGYPNAVYGWKTLDYTTDAVASNFTINATGGVNDGAYITTNGGGTGSEKTIRKSIAVEVGKTYYFSVYTSGKAPSANNFKYNALFKMSDATTETGTIKEFEWPQGAGNTTTEWNKTECTFTAETPYVGVRMGWNENTNFDEFVLAEVTSTTEGNVDYATAAIPTANIGENAFQYSQAAIDAANALVQGEATVEDVQNAYEAVTTLNIPEETQAYNLVFNCEGHSATGNALTLIPNPKQTQGLYGLQYLAPANVNLAQAFYFVHTTGNKYKVFAVDTVGANRYITTQAEGYGTTWYDGIRTITDASKAMQIEIRPNGEGLYLLWNTGANKAIAHNGSNNIDMFTNNTANFQFVETTKPAIAINTTAAGWGTVMLPFAQALPEGVKAYTCESTEGDRLTLTKVDALEANKPYLVEGAWNNTVTGDAQGTALTYADGLFTGVYANQSAPVGSYVLQKNNDALGFYKVAEGKQPTVKANRAYLTVPASARVAFFFGEEGETTSISALQSLSDGNVEIYNTNGVRIPSLQKGMNILKMSDGKIKKVMVK